MTKEGLVQTVAPQSWPVSVAEVASYLRAPDEVDDAHISLLIEQAVEEVTRITGRALTTATFRATFSTWPKVNVLPGGVWLPEFGRVTGGYSRVLELPVAPLLSVTSVQYYADDAETLSTLSDGNYIVATDNAPGLIYLKDDYDWPDLEERPDAVHVTFKAGYGLDPKLVPARLRMAILLLCRYYYAGGSPNGLSDGKLDMDRANAILDGYKITGFTA